MKLPDLALRFPLTLFGTLLLLASMLLLGSGLVRSDALASAGGMLALTLTVAAAVIPRFIDSEGLMEDLHWDSGGDLLAGSSNESHYLRLSRWRLPPFFRFHGSIRARLAVGDQDIYRSRREYRLEDISPQPVELAPPLPGTLFLHGEFSVKDIFGIGRRHLGRVLDRQVAVLPARFPVGDIRFVDSRTSEEDNSRAKKSEQEKIFIRDNNPGDLARDINWKASGRVNKLLTRIPPESEAKTKLIRVMLISETGGEANRAGYHFQLAAVKSLAAGFLDAVQRQHPGYLIDLFLNGELFPIDGSEGFDAARKRLARWLPPPHLDPADLPKLESAMMIFSHSLCADLPRFLRGYPPQEISLFIVQGSSEADDADLKMSLFPHEPGPGDFMPLMKPVDLRAPKRSFAAGHIGALREFVLVCEI
jgi:hypothetical protein